ncbi:hypothetical protein ACQP3L_36145, partial [Escherichia coli]
SEGMENYSIIEKEAGMEWNRLGRPIVAQTGRTRLSEILLFPGCTLNKTMKGRPEGSLSLAT